MLDDTEAKVRAGDTVVQIGNDHAWSNCSDEPCQIAFIQIDGNRSWGHQTTNEVPVRATKNLDLEF